eukprot:6039120-Pleurochrysis_carterae.AAC.1
MPAKARAAAVPAHHAGWDSTQRAAEGSTNESGLGNRKRETYRRSTCASTEPVVEQHARRRGSSRGNLAAASCEGGRTCKLALRNAGGEMTVSTDTNSHWSGEQRRRGGWGAPGRWLKEGALSSGYRPSRA